MTTTPDPSAALEKIRDRAGAFAKFGPPRPALGFGSEVCNAAIASAGDTPVLLAALEAALGAAADMDKDAAERYQRAAQLGDPRMAVDYHTEARQLRNCAKALREAITDALTGKDAGDAPT